MATASTCISNGHRSRWPWSLFPDGGRNLSLGAPCPPDSPPSWSHWTPSLSFVFSVCIKWKRNANRFSLFQHPEHSSTLSLLSEVP